MFTFLVFVSYKPDVVGLHLRNNLTPRCGEIKTKGSAIAETARVTIRSVIPVDRLAVWLSGNALASINVVALRQTRLVLIWVTVCGRVNHFGM